MHDGMSESNKTSASRSRYLRSGFWLIVFTSGIIVVANFYIENWNMRQGLSSALAILAGSVASTRAQSSGSSHNAQCASSTAVDLSWHAPAQTYVNNLTVVANGTGIYDYVFNSSTTPSSLPYSTYNWCNMPHVRSEEYKVPDADFVLRYVEIIHRHHKRTPYASNTFPREAYPWLCDDQSLFYYGSPSDGQAARIAWNVTPSALNPFQQTATGFPNSTCQFPQITSGGLLDSRLHGQNLRSVYIDTLHFLPDTFDASKIQFRVTNNQITSQVAGEVAIGLYPGLNAQALPVTVQPTGVDSLEPQYTCTTASNLYSSYGVGSNNTAWLAHLNATSTVNLYAQLDAISGVSPSSKDWHTWFDHYFDNLSAKLCHNKPLPCNITNTSLCVTPEMADAVFRRGQYEYSYIYRDNPSSLNASVGSFGVWMSELAHNMRGAMNTSSPGAKWRHNIAHDGSMSRLLSILQIDMMVWPGMGSEVVFELWQRKSSDCWFVRVLWKGQVLESSNPSLGEIDMIPVQSLLGYIDGLVGIDAQKVPGLCKS